MAHLENDFLKISFPEQARVNAEEHAATLQRQRVIEEKKMKELEKIREQLETLLVGWLASPLCNCNMLSNRPYQSI